MLAGYGLSNRTFIARQVASASALRSQSRSSEPPPKANPRTPLIPLPPRGGGIINHLAPLFTPTLRPRVRRAASP